MDAYALIHDNIKYNNWANSRIVDWLQQQKDDILTKSIHSSYPNLYELIRHILNATAYYLGILKETELSLPNELSNTELFERLISVDEQLLTWYQEQEPEIVNKMVSFKRSPYVETYTVATLITHMTNHSTYHRGQLVATRVELELTKPPKTDYYWMFAEEELQKIKGES